MDEFGIATAHKSGTATITASSTFYDVKATCTVQVVAKDYTVSWIIDGVTTTQTYHEGDKLNAPSVPEKAGYKFTGWTPNVPDKMPAQNMTFTAVFEKVQAPVIQIHNYVASRTIDYRATITFSVDEVQNKVDGAEVHWFIDGQDKGPGNSYTVKEAKKGFTVQAKYIQNGNVLAETQQETVNVKASFFARLVAFFRALFKKLPVIVQEYTGIEILTR